jgi:hypothetical protein
MSYDSDIAKIIKNAIAQGFRYSKTTSGHHQFYAPNGHDIVHHSGTPSDQRGLLNFVAQMKRAGYMELQTLGDAMPSEIKLGQLSATQHLIDLLSRHSEGVKSEDAKAYILTARPDLGKSSPSNAIHALLTRGAIKRTPAGVLMLEDVDKANIGRGKFSQPQASQARQEDSPEYKAPAGIKTGNPSIDKDLKALDEALSALAKIESVVRKNREVLVQFAKLKEMLK